MPFKRLLFVIIDTEARYPRYYLSYCRPDKHSPQYVVHTLTVEGSEEALDALEGAEVSESWIQSPK